MAATDTLYSYHLCSNFRMTKFSKKSAIKDFENKAAMDPATHHLLISHFEFYF